MLLNSSKNLIRGLSSFRKSVYIVPSLKAKGVTFNNHFRSTKFSSSSVKRDMLSEPRDLESVWPLHMTFLGVWSSVYVLFKLILYFRLTSWTPIHLEDSLRNLAYIFSCLSAWHIRTTICYYFEDKKEEAMTTEDVVFEEAMCNHAASPFLWILLAWKISCIPVFLEKLIAILYGC